MSQDNWESKWKEILENSDGSINVEQLRKELSDFDDLIDRMSQLTCLVTNNRLSYPTYPVKTIIGVMEDVREEETEILRAEDLKYGVCSLCDSELEGQT